MQVWAEDHTLNTGWCFITCRGHIHNSLTLQLFLLWKEETLSTMHTPILYWRSGRYKATSFTLFTGLKFTLWTLAVFQRLPSSRSKYPNIGVTENAKLSSSCHSSGSYIYLCKSHFINIRAHVQQREVWYWSFIASRPAFFLGAMAHWFLQDVVSYNFFSILKVMAWRVCLQLPDAHIWKCS